MGTIRILIGAAMLSALAASPAAAQAPLNILAASKQAKPATVTKKSKNAITADKSASTAAAKPRVRSVAKRSTKTSVRDATRRLPTPRKAFAQSGRGTVIRGPDTIALIAMLPWWRNDGMQAIEYGTEAANSKVMAATDAWLIQRGLSLSQMTTDDSLMAQAEDTTFDVAIADSEAVNEIDLAATPSSPPERSFIQSLIAVLGGALAAAAAGRFLFV
jgi:hypothetical protein